MIDDDIVDDDDDDDGVLPEFEDVGDDEEGVDEDLDKDDGNEEGDTLETLSAEERADLLENTAVVRVTLNKVRYHFNSIHKR